MTPLAFIEIPPSGRLGDDKSDERTIDIKKLKRKLFKYRNRSEKKRRSHLNLVQGNSEFLVLHFTGII